MKRFSLSQLLVAMTALAVGWGITSWLSHAGSSGTFVRRSTAIELWLAVGAIVGGGLLNLVARPGLGAILGLAFQAGLLMTMFERFHF
jgi:hypothetical protein